MKKRNKIIAAALGAVIVVAGFAGCESDSDVAARNLNTSAEQFEIERRITAINGITDQVMLEIEGRCSIETSESYAAGTLEVTCKLGPNEFTKHFIGLSDNVTFVVQQLEAVDASVYHHRVILKPENLLPEFDYEGGEQ